MIKVSSFISFESCINNLIRPRFEHIAITKTSFYIIFLSVISEHLSDSFSEIFHNNIILLEECFSEQPIFMNFRRPSIDVEVSTFAVDIVRIFQSDLLFNFFFTKSLFSILFRIIYIRLLHDIIRT